MNIFGYTASRATVLALLFAVTVTVGVGTSMLYVTKTKALDPGIVGIVWQPDNKTVGISGHWEKLGARELLVQWTVVDDQAFVPGTGLPAVPVLPGGRALPRLPGRRM